MKSDRNGSHVQAESGERKDLLDNSRLRNSLGGGRMRWLRSECADIDYWMFSLIFVRIFSYLLQRRIANFIYFLRTRVHVSALTTTSSLSSTALPHLPIAFYKILLEIHPQIPVSF